jgi:hypothetical protein
MILIFSSQQKIEFFTAYERAQRNTQTSNDEASAIR